MSFTFKLFVSVVILAILAALCMGVYKAFVGNMINSAPILFLILVFGVIFALAFGGRMIRNIWTNTWSLLLIAVTLTVMGCSHAKSNQQVLISQDCGMTWQKVNAGDAVPTGAGNMCFMKYVIPNFPMQGGSVYNINMKKVKVITDIDYDYSIVDALSFIKEAKSLGSSNQNVDSKEALDPAAFESAENRVIDIRIKDILKSMLVEADIVEIDQSDAEEQIRVAANKILEKYGVYINYVTLTLLPDEQTREAIDVTTAIRVYENKGMRELGEKIMLARAGAPKLNINTAPTVNTEQKEQAKE